MPRLQSDPMIPDWVSKILADLGLPGAIIFFLLLTNIASLAYIKSMQAKADKVYGYRLAERDALNKALTDAAAVLADIVESIEDRNDITEELANLIRAQAAALELLKVTVMGQFESIREYNATAAQAVGSMAEAIRTLTEIARDSRYAQAQQIDRGIAEIKEAIRLATNKQVDDIRGLLGAELTIVKRLPRSGTVPKGRGS